MNPIESVARATRLRRFERTRRANQLDVELPLTDNELDDARAAIAAFFVAIREPTPGMIRAYEMAMKEYIESHHPSKHWRTRTLRNGQVIYVLSVAEKAACRYKAMLARCEADVLGEGK